MAELPTKDELQSMLNKHRQGIKEDMNELISKGQRGGKRWLKNRDLMKLLNLSYTGLQNLRIKGFPYSKIQGTIFYDLIEIEKYMLENKVQ